MLKIRLKYLSIFLALTSLLSFLNILYSYYFNLYLNLSTYIYTLLISGVFALIFFKLKSNKNRPNLFEKIIFFRSVFNTIDMSLNGKKPPDEIKVKAKLKESKVLKPITSQVIKIKKVREK